MPNPKEEPNELFRPPSYSFGIAEQFKKEMDQKFGDFAKSLADSSHSDDILNKSSLIPVNPELVSKQIVWDSLLKNQPIQPARLNVDNLLAPYNRSAETLAGKPTALELKNPLTFGVGGAQCELTPGTEKMGANCKFDWGKIGAEAELKSGAINKATGSLTIGPF